jgi:hypothetical protein
MGKRLNRSPEFFIPASFLAGCTCDTSYDDGVRDEDVPSVVEFE